MPLFRPEATAEQIDRSHGTVGLAPPLSWQLLGFGSLVIVLAGAVFLQSASYARIEVVKGDIDTKPASAAVMSNRSGILTILHVSDRGLVKQGARLATIRTEDPGIDGSSGSQTVPDTLRRQDTQLQRQEGASLSASIGTRARLTAQVDGQTLELAALDEQIAAQRSLVASARKDVERMSPLLDRGFVTRRDAQSREDAVSTRVQQLAALIQARAEKSAAIVQTRRTIDEAVQQVHAANAEVEGQRAMVSRARSEVEAGRGYRIDAPIDGIVTALAARPGQPVGPGTTLLTIVPANARLRARLYVPTRSSGFLAVGQDVRLAIDAFPYAKFGTVPGRIETISTATSTMVGSTGQNEPVYLVTASVARPWVEAFGERRPLQPGMALSARIVTERRSLFEWLFDPVLAVRRR